MECCPQSKPVANVVIETTNREGRHAVRVGIDSSAVNECPRSRKLWSRALLTASAYAVTAPYSLSPGVPGITMNTRMTMLPNGTR